jgi:hypothetical protein
MTTLLEIIQDVAEFADTKAELTPGWGAVVFQDGKVWAQSHAGGAVEPLPDEHKALECVVNARTLIKAMKAVRGTDPALAVDNDKLLIASGESQARIPTMLFSTCPTFALPPGKTTWLHAGGLNQLDKVTWACSKDGTRAALCGVCLTAEYAVATNGHVMARHDIQVPGLEAPLVLPPTMVQGLPEECWLSVHGQRLFIATEKPKKGKVPASLRGATIADHVFPPWEQVMNPALDQPTVKAPAAEVLELLKRAKVSHNNLMLEVATKRLRVRTEEGRGGLFDFVDSVSLEVPKKFPEGCVGLDNTYLLPMIAAVEEDTITIHMELTEDGSLTPVAVAAGEYTAVVMPIRM